MLKNPDPKKHGWAVAPRQGKAHQAVFHLAEARAVVVPGPKLIVRLDHQFEFSYPGFSLGRFRISVTADEHPALQPGVARGHHDDPVEFPPAKRTAEQTAALLEALRRHRPRDQGRARRDRPAQEGDRRDPGARCGRPSCASCPRRAERITKVHRRGNFLDQGEPVQPATPGFFPPLPKEAPRNRLGVAVWLSPPRTR